MEQKRVCITLTAQQLEALNTFAGKQDGLTEMLWEKMANEAASMDT
jgi:hypothetical protein